MKWGAYAMAGDVGGVDASQAGFFTAAATAVGAALGACGLWLANRLLGKAAIQAQLNLQFKDFTDQLQEERAEMKKAWDAERASWRDEKVAWAGERAQLRGEIINLTQSIESLKSLLRRNGIDVPVVHRPAPDFDVIPGGGHE